jgi:hypothetical protein
MWTWSNARATFSTLSSAPHKTVIKSLFIFKKQEENHQVEKISVKSPFMFKTWAR